MLPFFSSGSPWNPRHIFLKLVGSHWFILKTVKTLLGRDTIGPDSVLSRCQRPGQVLYGPLILYSQAPSAAWTFKNKFEIKLGQLITTTKNTIRIFWSHLIVVMMVRESGPLKYMKCKFTVFIFLKRNYGILIVKWY